MPEQMTRKGVWWVETASGDQVKRTDRFRLEYRHRGTLYVFFVEATQDGIAIDQDSVRVDGDDTPLPEETRAEVVRGMLALLRFAGDPFTLQ